MAAKDDIKALFAELDVSWTPFLYQPNSYAQAVQRQKCTDRISERNAVSILLKLKALGKIELLHSEDGDDMLPLYFQHLLSR